MFLDNDTFTIVLDSTPLVSIDFIIQNSHGHVLLGERKNRPAQRYWFVPGGRILKNESSAAAFKRLAQAELGAEFCIDDATLLGVYDHFYSDSVFGHTPSTHYFAIAYCLQLTTLLALPEAQHSGYRWFDIDDLLSDPRVHKYTKAYFSVR